MNNLISFAVVLTLLAGPAVTAPLSEPKSVNGLAVIEDLPEGPGPFPTVILAPGAGGDMRAPLLGAVADALTAEDVAVVRFDWTHRTADPANGKPSPDLGPETRDLAAALSLARGDRRLDPSRIVLVGKSLGSVVAYRLFVGDEAVRGLVMMTPVCSPPPPALAATAPPWVAAPYPDFGQQARPVSLVLGDQDAYCALPDLYRLAGAASSPPRIVVVSGDHGYADPGKSDPVSARNRDLAIRNVVDLVLASVRP